MPARSRHCMWGAPSEPTRRQRRGRGGRRRTARVRDARPTSQETYRRPMLFSPRGRRAGCASRLSPPRPLVPLRSEGFFHAVRRSVGPRSPRPSRSTPTARSPPRDARRRRARARRRRWRRRWRSWPSGGRRWWRPLLFGPARISAAATSVGGASARRLPRRGEPHTLAGDGDRGASGCRARCVGFVVGGGAGAARARRCRGCFATRWPSPGILGISAGASLGAVLTIFFGPGGARGLGAAAGAFAGAAPTRSLVFAHRGAPRARARLHEDAAAGRRRGRRAQRLVHDLHPVGVAVQLRRRAAGQSTGCWAASRGAPGITCCWARPPILVGGAVDRSRTRASWTRCCWARWRRSRSASTCRACGCGWCWHVAAGRRGRRRRRTDRVRRAAGAAHLAAGRRARATARCCRCRSSAAASSWCWPTSSPARCSRRRRSRSAWSRPRWARRSSWRCWCGAGGGGGADDGEPRARRGRGRSTSATPAATVLRATSTFSLARRRGGGAVRPQRRRQVDAAAAAPGAAAPARGRVVLGGDAGGGAAAARDRAAGGAAAAGQPARAAADRARGGGAGAPAAPRPLRGRGRGRRRGRRRAPSRPTDTARARRSAGHRALGRRAPPRAPGARAGAGGAARCCSTSRPPASISPTSCRRCDLLRADRRRAARARWSRCTICRWRRGAAIGSCCWRTARCRPTAPPAEVLTRRDPGALLRRARRGRARTRAGRPGRVRSSRSTAVARRRRRVRLARARGGAASRARRRAACRADGVAQRRGRRTPPAAPPRRPPLYETVVRRRRADAMRRARIGRRRRVGALPPTARAPSTISATLLLEVPGVTVTRTGGDGHVRDGLAARVATPTRCASTSTACRSRRRGRRRRPLDAAARRRRARRGLPRDDAAGVRRVGAGRRSSPSPRARRARRAPDARAGVGSFGTSSATPRPAGASGACGSISARTGSSPGGLRLPQRQRDAANPADDSTSRAQNNDVAQADGALRAALDLPGRRALTWRWSASGAIRGCQAARDRDALRRAVRYARAASPTLRYDSRDDLGAGGRLHAQLFASATRDRFIDPAARFGGGRRAHARHHARRGRDRRTPSRPVASGCARAP